MRDELVSQMQQLSAERRAFALATVVRARRPASVRPGDAALVLPDGTIDGFVGGVCAASSVRLHALRALETGEPLLLRLVPGDDESGELAEVAEGAVIEQNPCLSGGSLEIFLEPHLPALALVIVGDSPIARALERVGRAAGYDCPRSPDGDPAAVDGATAVVVASHGSDEEAVLAAALTAGIPYVALVASARRGAAVRAQLDLPEQLRCQLHTPAGLKIGARSPEEIAISILAELVAQRHSDPAPGRPVVAEAVTVAVDPVCSMQVAVTEATSRVQQGTQLVYFCSDGCRDAYARRHANDGVAG